MSHNALHAYPESLQQALMANRVVVLGSRLTDCRTLEQALATAGVPYQRLPLSMDSAENRAAFHALQAQLQWPHLPMVFLDGVFVGGEPELRTRLHLTAGESAGAREPQDNVENGLHVSVKVLAYAGWLPFFAGALANWWPSLPFATLWQVLLLPYAALIASFMAGSHWGFAVAARPLPQHELFIAIGFMLFSWPLLLLPESLALPALWLIFAGLLTTEPRLRRLGLISTAYFQLRVRLTIGVLLALAAALLAPLR